MSPLKQQPAAQSYDPLGVFVSRFMLLCWFSKIHPGNNFS